MQLIDLFLLSFAEQSGGPAIEFDNRDGALQSLTFGEVAARSLRLSRLFRQWGLSQGDRLAIYLPNCIEFVDVFLACMRLGVVLVPINVLYRQREIAHIISDSEPRAVVTSSEAFSLFPDGIPLWDAAELAKAADGQSSETFREAFDGDSPALLVYTSGTTGRSKGAVLSHNNCLANTANLIAAWRITSADRYLAVLPLFHVHGLVNGLLTWLASGCRMRLVERFEAAKATAWFRDFRPTLFFGVPTIYVRLLELPEESARAIGRQLRLFVSGSAALPAQVLEEFRTLFGHTILERYGMSETLMNLSNPYGGERRPGSVGFPLPGISVRIVNAEGVEVAGGETGELLVRGPNVFSGYWRNPQATGKAFVDGWFKTGDLAERSADGYYTLRGRCTDLIISGGFNIYPREIEEVLLEIAGIREVAVVGVPDGRRGEVPVAYVVSDAAIDAADMETKCRRMLASFKVPRKFVQVDALPRNAMGKVQKHLLGSAHLQSL
jgi:malonyl-CoA/methylmalonyl-CoA synthetase